MIALNGGARAPRAAAPKGHAPRGARPNPIYDPMQTLSGHSLKQAANALTDLEIRPQISALAQQIAASQRQGRAVQDQTAGYFRDLGAQAQQAYANQQAASQRLNSTLQGIGDQTQQQIGAAGQTAQGQLAPLQAKGLDGGSFASLAREIAAQQGLAATNAQTFRTQGAQQGANYEGLTANQMATGALRGQERLGQIANAFAQQQAPLVQREADVQASRGATFVKNLGSLRNSERSYNMSLQTLGLNTQKAADTTAYNQAKLNQAALDRQARTTAAADRSALDRASFLARWGITPEGLAKLPNPGQWLRQNSPYYTSRRGANGGLSLSARNSAYAQIDAAKSAIASLRNQTGGRLTTQQIRQILTTGSLRTQDTNGRTVMLTAPRIKGGGYGTFANAAMDLALNGYLSPANVRALHQAGLLVGGKYRYLKGYNAPPGGTGPPSPIYG